MDPMVGGNPKPDMNNVEEMLALRDEKREEMLRKLQRSQDVAEDKSLPGWEVPRVGELVMVRDTFWTM